MLFLSSNNCWNFLSMDHSFPILFAVVLCHFINFFIIVSWNMREREREREKERGYMMYFSLPSLTSRNVQKLPFLLFLLLILVLVLLLACNWIKYLFTVPCNRHLIMSFVYLIISVNYHLTFTDIAGSITHARIWRFRKISFRA